MCIRFYVTLFKMTALLHVTWIGMIIRLIIIKYQSPAYIFKFFSLYKIFERSESYRIKVLAL